MVFISLILVNLSFDVGVILFGEIHEKWEKWITDHVTVRTFPIQPLGHTVLQSSVWYNWTFERNWKKNRGNLRWTLFLSKRSCHTWWCNYSLRSYFERCISDCCAVEFHDWSCSCRVTQWDWYTIGTPISFSSIDMAVKMIDNLAGQCYTGKDEEQTRGLGQGPLVRALGCISVS